MAEVELKGVCKSFLGGAVAALQDIQLKIADGLFTAILGPSGCGKTTLLRIVAGLERPDAGEVLIAGRAVNSIRPHERNVAMVFQNYALYPHKRVFDNIAMGLRLRGCPRAQAAAKVAEVAHLLGIEHLIERYPKQLSGGQQQRVALARALVREPQVFLLDEPLSNLDAQVRDSTRSEIKRLFREIQATVLYVTHDQTEAMMMSDLLVVMEGGEIRQAGAPTHIYRNPLHRFVAEFIGTPRINMIAGRLENGRFRSEDGAIALDTTIRHRGEVWMGIRPEHLVVGNRAAAAVAGEAVLVEPMGSTNLITVKVGANELKALLARPPQIGEALGLSFAVEDALFFDARSGRRLSADGKPAAP